MLLVNKLLPAIQDLCCITFALLQEVCKIIWVAVSANDLVYAIMLAVATSIGFTNWKSAPPEFIPKRLKGIRGIHNALQYKIRACEKQFSLLQGKIWVMHDVQRATKTENKLPAREANMKHEKIPECALIQTNTPTNKLWKLIGFCLAGGIRE